MYFSIFGSLFVQVFVVDYLGYVANLYGDYHIRNLEIYSRNIDVSTYVIENINELLPNISQKCDVLPHCRLFWQNLRWI